LQLTLLTFKPRVNADSRQDSGLGSILEGRIERHLFSSGRLVLARIVRSTMTMIIACGDPGRDKRCPTNETLPGCSIV